MNFSRALPDRTSCPFGLLSLLGDAPRAGAQTDCRELTDFPGWRFRFHERMPRHWPEDGSVFSRRAYLDYVLAEPQGCEGGLVVLEHDELEAPIGLVVQYLSFDAGGQIRVEEGTKSGPALRLRAWVAALLRYRVLTLGHYVVSGPVSATLSPAALEAALPAGILPTLAEELARGLGGFAATIIKDFQPAATPRAAAWRAAGYHQLPVDPVMEITRDPAWQKLDDYVVALSSKYRVRYRRTRKKLGRVVCLPLDEQAAHRHGGQFYELYNQLSGSAGFNAVELQADYFLRLYDVLGEDYRLYGYFLEDRLVGFRTEIADGEDLRAHYLGFDQQVNHSHQLYHNMLFDLLESTICGGFARLDLARTALEIKSSVGAVPVDYFCGLRMRNRLLNRLVPFFAGYLSPPTAWIQRSPFREEG